MKTANAPASITLTVPASVFADYVDRGEFWEVIPGPGPVEVDLDTALDMLDDAEHYADEYFLPRTLREGYALIRSQVAAAITH